MSNRYIFVFSSTPDSDSVLQGVFPIEHENEAKKFNDAGGGYRVMMVGDWSFGKFPERNELEPYNPKKGFYPAKVIGSKKKGFHVFLEGCDGFGDYYLFEGDFEDCQRECDTLNGLLQAHLSKYQKENV